MSVSALPGAKVPTSGRNATANGNVDYNGGPVLHSSAPYLIFWDPSGTITGRSRTVLTQYLTDVAADSGKATNVFSVLRQYTDSTGFADYQQTFSASQAIIDTHAYPTTDPSCPTNAGSYPNCVTDAQLQAEVTRLITADSLPTGIGPNAPIYFIITPKDTNICSPGSGCGANNDFCAYHSSFTDGSSKVLYSSVPFIVWTTDPSKGCQTDGTTAYQSPNGDPADNIADDLSHELDEAITDPLGTAWYNNSASGSEVADNCEAYGPNGPLQGESLNAYEPVLGGSESAGTLYDQAIHGDHYYTQTVWSNGDVGCEAQTSADTLTPRFTDSANHATVSFDPTTSTASEGSITSITWSFGDGSSAFRAGSPVPVSHTYAVQGTYTVTATIVDSFGNVATVSHSIGEPPTASFTGPTSGVPGTAVTFDGSGSSDPDSSIVGYSWSFGDGTTSASGPTTSHTYSARGTYTVTLTVTNANGLHSSTSHQITIGTPPTASFTGPTSGLAGTAITFDGSGSSDPDSSLVGYSWSFGDGTTSASGPITSHTYSAPGTYTITLTVTNANGLHSSTSHQITIETPPTASFTGPTSGLAGTAFTFDGSGSTDPDSSIVGYSWSFGDGATSASGPIASHTYSAPGTYTVTLTVTDSNRLQSTTSHQITVDELPTAAFTGPASGLAGTAVTLDGSGSSDPDGSIVSYSWSFGDGTTSASGPTAAHTYSAPGTYTVILTITDSGGLQSATSHQIAISAAGLGKVKVSGNTATLTVTCKGVTACPVTLQLSVTETSQRGNVIAVTAAKRTTKTTKKTVVVGKASVSLSGGQTRTIQITLNQAGRRLLAKFHKLKVTLAILSGSEGISHTTITFKESPPKPKK